MSTRLDVRGVSLRYGRLDALKDVSLSVNGGEIVGIIGPNGAGKSSLIDVISGRTRAVHGDVVLDGVALAHLPAYVIARRGVVRTFQVARPFGEATAHDAVVAGALARTRTLRDAHAIAGAALVTAGLEDAARVPFDRLDVAERKRLQLAQALAVGPRVLLLDEIMAGLPPADIDAFVATIGRLRSTGIAVLVVEHVMRAITALADRIVVLHHGEKIADKTPDAVFRDPVVMRAYLGPRFAAASGGFAPP